MKNEDARGVIVPSPKFDDTRPKVDGYDTIDAVRAVVGKLTDPPLLVGAEEPPAPK